MSSSLARPLYFFLATCFCGVFVQDSAGQLRFPFGQRQREAVVQERAGSQGLSEAAGPWLIMCASFGGGDGMHQARQLAEELSADQGLPTYVYRHEFNVEKRLSAKGLGQTLAQRAQNVGGPGKLKLASSGQFAEVAVLVGDFPSIDDGRAQSVLNAVKSYQPTVSVSALDVASSAAGDRVRSFRDEVHDEVDGASLSEGPLRTAFLLPNPMLPEEYFSANPVDEFVVKLNKSSKYNLLKSDGKYTVKVATFSGETQMINDSVSEKLQAMKGNSLFKKSKKASDLETALIKATVLARYLRKYEKLEAYEYHDRNASYVCVGSFDWTTRQTGIGNEMNPELKATLKKFTFAVQGRTQRGIEAKSFPLPNKLTDVGITCSASPEIIPVPQAPATSVASRLMNKIR